MDNYEITETDLWAYVSKKADKNTMDKVEEWKNSKDYDPALFNKIVQVYKITGENPYHEVRISEAKMNFFNSVKSKNVAFRNWKNVFKYAAAVALLISTATYILLMSNSSEINLQTSFGEHQKVELQDGSVVWLNSSTRLTYSQDSPRKLYLEGEAFFEVAKNKEVPFVVITQKDIQVMALGTSFNVKAYKSGNYVETKLFTGKVEVSSTTHFKEKMLMHPKDKITFFNKEKRIVRSKFNENAIAWKQKKIRFENQTFNEIALELFIKYNVKIKFESRQISKFRFTGSFDEKTPINEILETLKLSKSFEYKRVSQNEWLIK